MSESTFYLLVNVLIDLCMNAAAFIEGFVTGHTAAILVGLVLAGLFGRRTRIATVKRL